jgi:hypothetical protein
MTSWSIAIAFTFIQVAFDLPALQADTLTPADLAIPFAVQPFVGLQVMGGVTQPFFSDLSALSFPGPGIVDVLGNIQAFGVSGNPISMFQLTGVTVTQGASTLTPPLQTFEVQSPITYVSTLNPLNQVTLVPSALNLGFTFNSNPSFQYSYTLSVTGIPNGGFLLYDDVEGARVPEPSTWWLTLTIILWSLPNETRRSTRAKKCAGADRTARTPAEKKIKLRIFKGAITDFS